MLVGKLPVITGRTAWNWRHDVLSADAGLLVPVVCTSVTDCSHRPCAEYMLLWQLHSNCKEKYLIFLLISETADQVTSSEECKTVSWVCMLCTVSWVCVLCTASWVCAVHSVVSMCAVHSVICVLCTASCVCCAQCREFVCCAQHHECVCCAQFCVCVCCALCRERRECWAVHSVVSLCAVHSVVSVSCVHCRECVSCAQCVHRVCTFVCLEVMCRCRPVNELLMQSLLWSTHEKHKKTMETLYCQLSYMVVWDEWIDGL